MFVRMVVVSILKVPSSVSVKLASSPTLRRPPASVNPCIESSKSHQMMSVFLFKLALCLSMFPDVDECVSGSSSVCVSQRCENTIGSYRCLASCQAGYQVAPDGSCVGESTKNLKG